MNTPDTDDIINVSSQNGNWNGGSNNNLSHSNQSMDDYMNDSIVDEEEFNAMVKR